jgi:hypothetical protein
LDLLLFLPELEDVDGLLVLSVAALAKDKTGRTGNGGSFPGPFSASTKLIAW